MFRAPLRDQRIVSGDGWSSVVRWWAAVDAVEPARLPVNKEARLAVPDGMMRTTGKELDQKEA